MKEVLIVFVGSGLGGVTRFGCQKLTDLFYLSSFPLATLLTNVIASFLVGVLVAVSGVNPFLNKQMQMLLITGFCGGMSTFSAFSEQTIQFIQQGQIGLAIIYITASLLLSISACLLGHQIISTYA
ncbi:MAG: CrcB family protein [Candidatus Competibacteraceae bacterium]|nr:CrcB family protein [Candidatus Competibacteraceae bacterium]